MRSLIYTRQANRRSFFLFFEASSAAAPIGCHGNGSMCARCCCRVTQLPRSIFNKFAQKKNWQNTTRKTQGNLRRRNNKKFPLFFYLGGGISNTTCTDKMQVVEVGGHLSATRQTPLARQKASMLRIHKTFHTHHSRYGFPIHTFPMCYKQSGGFT